MLESTSLHLLSFSTNSNDCSLLRHYLIFYGWNIWSYSVFLRLILEHVQLSLMKWGTFYRINQVTNLKSSLKNLKFEVVFYYQCHCVNQDFSNLMNHPSFVSVQSNHSTFIMIPINKISSIYLHKCSYLHLPYLYWQDKDFHYFYILTYFCYLYETYLYSLDLILFSIS